MLSRPKLGVCSWIFGDVPLAGVVKTIAELDYDGIELQGDFSRYSGAEAKQLLQDHGLDVFAVSPLNVDLVADDESVRAEAFSYYLKLLDFAAEVGSPLVIVRGMKGRTRPYSTKEDEVGMLETAVAKLADEANQRNLNLAVEVLNRYESHLITTGAEALEFVARIEQENVGILLNSFHTSIEEQDAATTIRNVGDKLALYFMADSNRQAIGRGHTKLGNDLWGMEDIGYDGPVIMEFLPPNSDPFLPQHDEDAQQMLKTYLQESRSWF